MSGRRTTLYPQHIAAGARMVDFAGWDMPQQYGSVRDEQHAVRTAAGLFDVSHMGRFEVRGGDGASLLQSVLTGDVEALEEGRALYSLMCRDDGGIVDDLVVYRRPGGWSVVVNAANRRKDLDWLVAHAAPGVDVADRSEETSLLALQGPAAERQLAAAGADATALPHFGIAEMTVAGVPCVVSRTGYTGEDGFEVFVPAGRSADVWAALVAAGACPCGLAARDVCRLEAALRLYGSDMDELTNPYEVGLGWTVRLDKGEFVGRAALQRVKQEGRRRQLIGLVGGERTIPRHGAAVRLGGRTIGAVTSGTYSFWLGKGIGLALVDSDAAPVGTEVTIALRNGDGTAEVVRLPFYRSAGRAAARSIG